MSNYDQYTHPTLITSNTGDFTCRKATAPKGAPPTTHFTHTHTQRTHAAHTAATAPHHHRPPPHRHIPPTHTPPHPPTTHHHPTPPFSRRRECARSRTARCYAHQHCTRTSRHRWSRHEQQFAPIVTHKITFPSPPLPLHTQRPSGSGTERAYMARFPFSEQPPFYWVLTSSSPSLWGWGLPGGPIAHNSTVHG